MSIFYTDKKAKEEIAELNQRIEALDNDNTSAQEQIETLTNESKDLTEKVESLETQKGEMEKQIETLTSELEEASNQLEKANEKLETFDDEVEAAAQTKFESLGGQPAPHSNKEDGEVKEMTREQFNQMNPAERTAFAKSGGKIKS